MSVHTLTLQNVVHAEPTLDTAAHRAMGWLEAQMTGLFPRSAVRLHAAALARTCAIAPSLRTRADAFCDRYCHIEVGELPGVDSATARLAWKAADSTGYEDQYEDPPPVALGVSLLEYLAAGQYGARRAVDLIENVSLWGNRSVMAPPPCAALLEGAALAAARSFDLIFALRCARAAAYCTPSSKLFSDTIIAFTHALQGPDGAFLAISGLGEAGSADPELAFIVRCSTCVQAVWTLAEFTQPGLRLMQGWRMEPLAIA